MANEISMADKQSIAGLHGQGLSNRRIAGLLGLDRGTVGRQVALLKAQSPPPAPTGNFSEKGEESRADVVAETMAIGAGTVTATEAERPAGQGAGGPVGKAVDAAEETATGRLPGSETKPLAATTGAPTGKVTDQELIWDEVPQRTKGQSSKAQERLWPRG